MNKSSKLTIIPVMLCFFAMGFVDLVGIASNYVKEDLNLNDSTANLFPSLVFFWFLIRKDFLIMSTLKTPFRYDFVGSFLRPQALKDAKTKYQNNDITKDEYDKIVNEEITKLVAKQKELGFHAITDGEFRRTFWHLDFMWGFDGVEHKATGGGVPFNDELAVLDDTYLIGKFKAKAHPFVEYFKFLKQFEDENTVAKYTIPAPAQTYLQFIVPGSIEKTTK